MRIALIGYGRMGREVERAAREAGIEVGPIFTSRTNPDGQGLTEEALRGVDVCVDFSTPEAVLINIRRVVEVGTSMVVGTTGWYDRLGEVRPLIERAGIGFVYGPNFCLGVNLLFRLVEYGAQLLRKFPDFDPYVVEWHHRWKADHPSGTALRLGQILLKQLERKTHLVTQLEERIPQHGISVASIRSGSHPGTHLVGFDAPFETLEIIHRVRHRRAFAVGALWAAQFAKEHRGVFSFEEVLDHLLQGGDV
ncbi:MAG: 4-hydroxy-tetrahydrodipicolinate reductase [Blastocatellia bacterium]|nr:4-hydroxy-tetrahydrodipicolinate reductase [Blastocatellia bacterium]MCS7157978.1 4-hydroxy-tetrahydrodipicolinate reductase [Blastocatellia bacterium]MCX7752485.1 4-hydroxy-tetrahydrodipicolinate reductase [Blastocatellia bacterium]MDW8167400.1 4-hydroxy-tetrahydrodipicolinate reductase [Acidobacteriota bacterium]MDW8257422.1 4-hydroxy-tetrahydrodipicolinate reductase [Acidobacteriota bacterium]